MLKFVRDRHRIAVDPLSLTLEPLLKIWLSDKSEAKEEATRKLTYLHLTSQIDRMAPYATAAPDEVSRLVRKELWGDYEHKFAEEDEINEAFMEEAVHHYQLAYETAEEAAVRAFDKKIYQINKIIETTEIEIKPSTSRGVTTYVSNFAIIDKMMLDLPKIVKTKDEIKALILKSTTRETMKGNKKMSFADKRRRELVKSAETARAAAAGEAPEEEEPMDL